MLPMRNFVLSMRSFVLPVPSRPNACPGSRARPGSHSSNPHGIQRIVFQQPIGTSCHCSSSCVRQRHTREHELRFANWNVHSPEPRKLQLQHHHQLDYNGRIYRFSVYLRTSVWIVYCGGYFHSYSDCDRSGYVFDLHSRGPLLWSSSFFNRVRKNNVHHGCYDKCGFVLRRHSAAVRGMRYMAVIVREDLRVGNHAR